jgi:hypothetical protein
LERAQPGDAQLFGDPKVLLRGANAYLVPDPELFRLRRFDPFLGTGLLADGCPFSFRVSADGRGYSAVEFLGPLDSLDRNYAHLRTPIVEPTWTPVFEGYRHVWSSATFASTTHYLGVWHRMDGGPGSLVAAYDVARASATILGKAVRTYDSVHYYFTVHQFMFTLVDEADASQPLVVATFERVPPAYCCGRRRRRT